MVSHAIGIVGVIFQIASSGGAWIATLAGLLSTGSKKANRWIPADKYVIKYRANKVANIAPELEIIQQLILSGPKCQKMHHPGGAPSHNRSRKSLQEVKM